MNDFELALILLVGLAMLLIGLFMILRICDRQIARAARRLARPTNGRLVAESRADYTLSRRWKAE